jgi:hypothetical protein
MGGTSATAPLSGEKQVHAEIRLEGMSGFGSQAVKHESRPISLIDSVEYETPLLTGRRFSLLGQNLGQNPSNGLADNGENLCDFRRAERTESWIRTPGPGSAIASISSAFVAA